MSSQKIKILWVDDEVGNHKEDARNLEYKNKNLKITIIHPNDFKESFSKMTYDLFLIDYYLGRVGKNENGEKYYNNKGLTISGMIREEYSEHPIYGMTVESMKVFKIPKDIFDKFLTFKDVQNKGHNDLYYDAIDFKSIRESERGKLESIFELLKAPSDIRERLNFVIPTELRSGLKEDSNSNTIAFAKWVLNILLVTPGFLYNELYSATHLGITIKAFKRLSDKFKKAKYAGVFSKTSEDLWWGLILDNIVFSKPKAKKSEIVNTWELAPIAFDIPEDEQSKCVVCGKKFPETVGINLDDEGDIQPVHYRCSIPHPKVKRQIYFDEPRAFRREKFSARK